LGLGKHHSFDTAMLLHWYLNAGVETRDERADAHANRNTCRNALDHAYLVGYNRADRDTTANSYPVVPAHPHTYTACYDHADRYRNLYTNRDADTHADVDVYIHSDAY
jgi:hypothetical protein